MIKEILQSEYDEVYSFVNEECGNEKDAFEIEDAKKASFPILKLIMNNILTLLPLMKD